MPKSFLQVAERQGTRSLGMLGLVFVLSAISCAPSTPTPAAPTVAPSVQPTPNARATEASIISHVFATMTASAPTPTKAAVAATTAPVSASKPTATPRPRVTVKPTNTAAPAAPKATIDPYLEQIPKGKGGILLVSFIGTTTNFSISGASYSVDANGKRLVVVDPGTYSFSVQVIGPPGGAWNDLITVVADQYQTYRLIINP